MQTVDLWLSKHAFQQAGALAFYTLFSMAPLLILLVTFVGAIYGEEAARGEIASVISGTVGDQAATAVEGAISQSRVSETGLLPTLLGALALLFGATTVFAQLQAGLNQLWDVRARPSRRSIVVFLMSRLVSLGVVLAIGLLLLVSFVLSATLAALIRFAEGWIAVPPLMVAVADATASVAIATLLFATIFKLLPDVQLRWRDMWRGAGITALLFVGGQSLISWYLALAAPASTYGAAGSLVVVLFWVYYSALIIFFGAALTRTTVRRRGDLLVPTRAAVKVRTTIVEDGPADDDRSG